MTKMPVAGVVWQTAHYLVGLRRLGFDVYYVEAHARTPSMFMNTEQDDGTAKAAAFIDQVCGRFDLAGKWAYHALHEDGRIHGMSDSELSRLYREAALIINLHGGTIPHPEHYATGRLIYLETDPVELQIQLHEGSQEAIDFLAPHCAFFTFGENFGRPGCELPVSDRFHFKPTRQPVVCDFWRPAPPSSTAASAGADAGGGGGGGTPGRPFTTIGNWEQQWRQVHFRGETYHWSKHHEFLKFIDLPSHVNHGTKFELALSSYDESVEQMLRSKGWEVRAAMGFSMDADAYRDYIRESRGEFTVAKDQNVRLRTGWFSDRSATYLAAGRPVITQDTAFGEVLPTGEGLFPFQTMDDVLGAVDAISSDYDRHSRAAAAVAREHFAHDVVLPQMLGELGL
jgi:hypothetical protein